MNAIDSFKSAVGNNTDRVHVRHVSGKRGTTVNVTMKSQGTSTSKAVMPDTGADITLAPPSILDEVDGDINNLMAPTEDLSICGPSGETITSLGTITAQLTLADYKARTEIHIVDNVDTVLLS